MPQVFQRETFSFDPQGHESLTRWLAQWPRGKRSGAIVAVLAQHIEGHVPEHSEIMAELRQIHGLVEELPGKLAGLVGSAGPGPAGGQGTDDLLDIMDNRFQ